MKLSGLFRTICSSHSTGNAARISKNNHKVIKGVISPFFDKDFLCFSHVLGTVSDAENTLNQEIDKQECTM